MAILQSNQRLGPRRRLSVTRKLFNVFWPNSREAAIYSEIEVPAEEMLNHLERLNLESSVKVSVSHYICKAVAETIRQNPVVHQVVRLGGIYERKDINIFFQVASGPEGEPSDGVLIRNADQKNLKEIAVDFRNQLREIQKKSGKPPSLVERGVQVMPRFLIALGLRLCDWFFYQLNLWSPILGVPRDPLGSAMVSNVGALDSEGGFPLTNRYYCNPFTLVLGKVSEVPVVREGQVVPGKVFRFHILLDHRVIDGSHFAKIIRSLKQNCAVAWS